MKRTHETGEVTIGDGILTTHTKVNKCISCGTRLDCVSDVEGQLNEPRPNDLTFCLRCGALMALADDLTVRPLTAEEVKRYKNDTELQIQLNRYKDALHYVQEVMNAKEK